jgi:uncharacterized surface protein with fasciclin (FAS1) repeats
MTDTLHNLLGAAALTLAIGGLAACGGGGEQSETPAVATAESTTTTPAASTATTPAEVEGLVTVGGAPMYPNKTIVENASQSQDHTTLVSAVQAAGLVDTLNGAGPFTVFAPTNAAFEKLPAGTVDTLVKPENKAILTSILTYHVVPGAVTAAQLTDGQTLTTVEGGTLTVAKQGNMVTLTDEKGGKSMVTQADVMQSNGVVHVVDSVVQPG